MPTFVVESMIDVRTFEKPFQQRQILGEFNSANEAYEFITKYISDTKEVYTYFARNYLCTREEFDDFIGTEKAVAINIVLGQFEDTLYVNKIGKINNNLKV
jgi:hypothetical protein